MKNSETKNDEKIIKWFCCMQDECGRTFATKFNLKRHVQTTHNKVKRFACSYCDKKFASKQNVMEHTFIHTGERPFECNTCNLSFRQASQLSLHKRTHDRHSQVSADKKPFQATLGNISEDKVIRTQHTLPPISDNPPPVLTLPSLFVE